MLVLVTTSSRSKECSAAIEQVTHHTVQIVGSVARAVRLLQSQEFEALILDESFVQTENGGVELLLSNAGLAVPIWVNLALHGCDRVAREVQAGLLRFVREKLAAMRSAESLLRNELHGEVTSILLSSELALRDPAVSGATAERLQAVHDVAERMRSRLEAVAAVAHVASTQAAALLKRQAGV